MSDCRKYVDYIMEQAKNLLAIDSPSGYGREVTEYLLKELEALGVQARRTVKGGVIADFGGRIRKTESCWRPTATPWEAWLPRLRKTAG